MREALVFLLMTAAATAARAEEPNSARQSELIYQLKQDCGSCHGLTLKGGLGPSLLPSALGDKDDEVLVNVILDGLPRTPMPPWRFEISREEALWLVRKMKKGLADDL